MSKKFLIDIDLNGNELQNAVVQNLASAPENPKEGQHYYDTVAKAEFYWNGTAWINAAGDYTFKNGVEQVSGSRDVQIKIASGANAGNVTLTANSNGLKAAVAEASTSAKGIIEIADATEIAAGTATDKAVTPAQLANKVEKNAAITAGTHTKITYDAKGLVTAGADLAEADIPSLHLAKITDVTASAAEVNVLDGIEATTAELNIMHGITASTDELNYVDGVTSSIQDQLDAKVEGNTAITGATKCKITYDSKGLVTAGADLAASDIPSLTLAKISDVTATATEVNVLDGITASTDELNILDGVTADASELNILDGATLTTTELNYVDGVTSSIQDQLDSKVAKNAAITAGTGTVVTYDAKGLVTGSSELAIKSTSANYLEYDSTNHEFGAKVDTNVTADSTNLVTSGAVKAAIDAAVTGGVHYAGTWDITSATDFSGITLPQTKGALFYVKGTGPKTIGGIEWNAGDYLLINADVAAGGSLTGKVEKIDNTESADIVRLNAAQTLTNKTIDADDNTISDLTTTNFKSGTVATTVAAASSAADTKLPSEKAVRTELDKKQDKVSTAVENNIASWDAAGNTKDSGKSFSTSVRASTSASDSVIATEKAVATFVENSISGTKAEYKNGAITPVSGTATWSLSSLPADPMNIVIIETATGEQVEMNIAYGTKAATITFNASSAVTANTYTAKVLF